MVGARTAVRGLSSTELQAIRDTLAAGRKPKVVFTESAGQVAGQVGQVIQLTDPAVSDEWVVVRFGRDELPFSPADLSIPPRGAAGRRPAKAGPQPGRPEPAAAATVPASALAPASATVPATVTTPAVPAPREETTMSQPPELPAGPATGPAAGPPAGSVKPARRAAKPARAKATPSLTVTLAYAEGEWTVGATQGSKALAKPYVIKPAEALKMVSMLDVAGVHEAVEQIVATERAEAQAHADRLRAELAEIEARLAELRDV